VCSVTVYVLNHTGKRGRGGDLTREKLEGQCFIKPVENTNMTDCISSL
jgi:hypothetical protein